MSQEQLQAIVQQAVDSFGAGFATCKIESNLVVIRDKKGRVMGNVRC